MIRSFTSSTSALPFGVDDYFETPELLRGRLLRFQNFEERYLKSQILAVSAALCKDVKAKRVQLLSASKGLTVDWSMPAARKE